MFKKIHTKILLLLCILACTHAQKLPKYAKIELKDWSKKPHKLANYLGKVVVLDYWATWCEPCKEAAPLVSQLELAYREKPVVFLGVNTDDPKMVSVYQVKKKANEFGITYNSLLDPKQVLVQAMGVNAQPALIFLDKQGQVFHKQYGLSADQLPGLQKKIDSKLKE
ncbi:MAG: TlpA disulfide reductase family protein [Spirochaetota bacterium]